MSRYYVDKDTGRLYKSDFCSVNLIKADGEVVSNLVPRRFFTMSNQDVYISLLNSSEKEVAMIKDIAELDDESRTAVEECLAEYYMMPKIYKIVRLSDKLGVVSITADTDRGRITFSYNNGKLPIKNIAKPNQKIFRDFNDSRYEIPDVEKLDKDSRKKLFGYI